MRLASVERASTRVPVRTTPVNPVVAVVFLGAIVLIFAALAIFNVYPSARFAFIAAAVFLMLFPVGVGLLNTRLKPGVVRFDENAASLRFIPQAAAPVLFFAAALVGLVPGIVALVNGLDAIGRGLAVISALCLVWVLQQLWALRLPAGLVLDEHGIRGVRGSKAVDLSWDDLAKAEVTAPKGIRLTLHLRPAGSVVIEPQYIGSDPNVLAPVINFFREHPQHRAALATPRAALELVEAHASARAD
ncbi:hypothetical protein GCM10027413_01050 [Conyzicola nivalis]|uniref:PH domain-containing protein n=1 Tax=Conyzicola nivalis TaxID=1477021 RepID=A0A916SPK8_9MICO|nr:hypothetical protein [Conyzicola nivalis]GGB09848.1 hypothetical protein GCM10010979_25590 [Conyzicola nivalis]